MTPAEPERIASTSSSSESDWRSLALTTLLQVRPPRLVVLGSVAEVSTTSGVGVATAVSFSDA